MQISPTYADRADLNRFEKWKYTLEERIGQNPRVRKFYRWWFFLPEWAQGFLGLCHVIIGVLPFIAAYACEALMQKILKDEDGDSYGEGLGLLLFFAAVCATPFVHPLGWVVVAASLWNSLVLWFFSGVMHDYDCQLQKETRQS